MTVGTVASNWRRVICQAGPTQEGGRSGMGTHPAGPPPMTGRDLTKQEKTKGNPQ